LKSRNLNRRKSDIVNMSQRDIENKISSDVSEDPAASTLQDMVLLRSFPTEGYYVSFMAVTM
jgi:hypothetical protein